MPHSYDIIDGSGHRMLTYSRAKDMDTNVFQKIAHYKSTLELYVHLCEHSEQIVRITRTSLRVPEHIPVWVAPTEEWLRGSFNLSIPILVDEKEDRPRKILMRIPMPHKVGELSHPGNVDEKLRSEAATMIHIKDRAPDVPIPALFGFGLSTGRVFVPYAQTSLVRQWSVAVYNKILKLLNYPTPIPYLQTMSLEVQKLGTGYLLIEYIEDARGQMLSESWDKGRKDDKLRQKLFQSLSRIMTSMSCLTFDAVGSLTISKDNYVVLQNRPFTIEVAKLESEGVATLIPRDRLYYDSESYYRGLLSLHDARLRKGTNVIYDAQDCRSQMSALTIMRIVLHHFTCQSRSHGPFALTLTDIHPSNLFVDKEWNITCVIDLEWACSRPFEMIRPPHWIAGHAVDTIDIDEYEMARTHFMKCLLDDESRAGSSRSSECSLAESMERGWLLGTFWYSLALDSPTGLHALFYDHIQPKYSEEHRCEEFELIVSQYWTPQAEKFVKERESDKRAYDSALKEKYDEEPGTAKEVA